MKIMVVLFLVSLTSVMGAASDAQQTAARSKEQEQAGANERQQYQEKIEAKLRELDGEIAALKAKSARQGKESGKDFNQQIAELEQKVKDARQKFDKLKESSQGAWQDMKVGIDAAVKDLQTAYGRAAMHFK